VPTEEDVYLDVLHDLSSVLVLLNHDDVWV
jgi:hypothetical protein